MFKNQLCNQTRQPTINNEFKNQLCNQTRQPTINNKFKTNYVTKQDNPQSIMSLKPTT